MVRAMRHGVLNLMSSVGARLRYTRMGQSKIVSRLHGPLARALHGSNRVQVGPFRVRVDPRDQLIARKLILYGGYEVDEIALLCSYVKAGDHVLDVGANIGLYSLHLSRAVGAEGRVIAVEPDPDNVAILRENLETNGCRNVTVVDCAFGNDSGRVDLWQCEHNRGALSLADITGSGRSIKVEMRRGGEVLADLGMRPTVAKIDVEGAEPLVLAGLGYWPAILLFEFVPSFIEALGQDPKAFLQELVLAGYTLELIEPIGASRRRMSPSGVMEYVTSSANDHNILATRSGKAEDLRRRAKEQR